MRQLATRPESTPSVALKKYSAVFERRSQYISANAGKVQLSLWAMYRRGFVMNVINPKVGLFFLAFLPQFVSRDGGSVGVQMFFLGLVFMLQGVVIFSIIGYLSGSLGDVLLKRPRIASYFGWLSAGIFALLGLKLALAER